MCFDSINKKIKKMNWTDVSLVKLSVVAFVLFVISFLSVSAINSIISFRWAWLILFIVFAIKPLYKVLK